MLPEQQISSISSNIFRAIVKSIGEIVMKEGEFEEIPLGEEKEEEEEEFVEIEEEGTGTREENMYRKSIGLGPDNRPVIIQYPPSLNVGKCIFAVGHNRTNASMAVAEEKICRGIGVNILLQDSLYQGHNQQITYLSYDSSRQLLISATQGKCSQLRLWRLIKSQNTSRLQELQKFHLPLNSLGIAFAAMYSDEYLFAVTKYTLHQSSQFFVFQISSKKRTRSQCAFGKVMQISNSAPVMLLNEEGIIRIHIETPDSCEASVVVEESEVCAFSEIIEDKDILVIGYLSGEVKAVRTKQKTQSVKIGVHQKGIKCITALTGYRFVTAGGDRKIMLHGVEPNLLKISTLSLLELSSSCLNMLWCNNELLCSFSTTEIVRISTASNVLTQSIDSFNSFSYCDANVDLKAHIIYNKYIGRYFIGWSDSPEICSFSLSQKVQPCAIKRLTLGNVPIQMDMHGSIIAYTCNDRLPVASSSKVKSKLKSHIKDPTSSSIKSKMICKQMLVLEDYPSLKRHSQLQMPEEAESCTILKFNLPGDKLALGFKTGLINIYYTNQPGSIFLLQTCNIHNSPILQLIWSEDGKAIKSISHSNLIYLDLLKDKVKLTPLYTSKQVKELVFPQCGKFDWKNSGVWLSNAHHPSDITDIKQTKQYLFVCMRSGEFKIYRNPAGKQSQTLLKLFQRSYQCEILREDEDKVVVLLVANGIMVGLEIGVDFSEESQEGSEEQHEEENP